MHSLIFKKKICFCFLHFLLFLILFISYAAAKTNCQVGGSIHLNGTSWKNDSCTRLTCFDGVIRVKVEQCRYPSCDQTETLYLPPNSCCPVCRVSSNNFCEEKGKIIAHGTAWKENCLTCNCIDGFIDCTSPSCSQDVTCSPGESLSNISGKCCPKCINENNSCLYEGRVLNDGETFSSLQCERVSCAKGELLLQVSVCQPKVCSSGEVLKLLEGQCCPSCVGTSCLHKGQHLLEGEIFEKNSCERCLCQSGELRCEVEVCDVQCKDNETLIYVDGRCCGKCVFAGEKCQFNGTTLYNGELLKDQSCQVHYCDDGKMESKVLECSSVSCGWNETLVTSSCCPTCVPIDVYCHYNGLVYRNGDQWQEGTCDKCECLNGRIQCFKPECLSCPDNTTEIQLQGECCSTCKEITCHESCLSCYDVGYGKCSSCPSNRLLQEGICVRRCLDGFYREQNLCKRCHVNCERCNQRSCVLCKSSLLLQEGLCIAECEQGFYQHNNECRACKKTCKDCRSESECLQCKDPTYIIQGKSCVENCDEGFFFTNQSCVACHSSCLTCSKQWNICDNCKPGWRLVDGMCVEQCPTNTFAISILRCERCHPSCLSCTSKTISSCLSCHKGFSLYQNTCFKVCPASHYEEAGICEKCHRSCWTCSGSSSDQCKSCKDLQVLTRNEQTGSGYCSSRCKATQYVKDGVCHDCHFSCASCQDSKSCLSCHDTDLIQVKSDGSFGFCEPLEICHEKSLMSSDSYCYNQSSIQYCNSLRKMSFAEDCYPECPGNTFLQSIQFGLDACVRCSEGCKKCTRVGVCEECEEGLTLSIITHQCVTTCESGFYKSLSGLACIKCPSTCASCYLDEFQTVRCSSCSNPLDVIQIGQCVSSCLSQFYPEYKENSLNGICTACDWTCMRCSGPSDSQCLECMPDKLLQEGQCVSSCQPGFYPDKDQCVPCSDNQCEDCEEKDQCNSCKASYYLLESKCVKTCPRSYFPDPVWKICRSCPAHCLKCFDRNSCEQCDRKSFLITLSNSTEHAGFFGSSLTRRSSPCKRKCDRGYYGNTVLRKCEKLKYLQNVSVQQSLRVGVGARIPIANVIHVSDAPYDLRVYLMMSPINGWFEESGNKIDQNTYFLYKNIEKVFFQHDRSYKRQHAITSIKLVADGYHELDEFEIKIISISLLPPKIIKNEILVVNYFCVNSCNETIKISSKHLLIVDSDSESDDVIISVVNPASAGKIVKLPNYENRVSKFTLTDLRNDVIAYVSQGNSVATAGTIRSITAVLQVYDGFHLINFALHIAEFPTNKSAPTLITNNILHLNRGGMLRLTSAQLLTVAPGIKDKSKIVYKIDSEDDVKATDEKSSTEFIMIIPTLSDAPLHFRPYHPSDWFRTSQGRYQSRPLSRMTQHEVNNGLIWLRHNPKEDEDRIKPVHISVYDESHIPATRIARSNLKISISRDNVESPRPIRSSESLVLTDVTRLNILNNRYLQYTDPDTFDTDIVYNITRPLPVNLGTIEHSDRPFIPTTVFTQADIDANKIVYRPPVRQPAHSSFNQAYMSSYLYKKNGQLQQLQQSNSNNQPKLPKTFAFSFTVSDGKHTLPEKNFTFKVNDETRDNQPPTFIHQYPLLEISRDGTATIGSPQLAIRDPDTSPNDLVFRLLRAPNHGTIMKIEEETKDVIQQGDQFTYDDVRFNRLKYIYHGGIGPRSDTLRISVSDGTHILNKVIQVSISAVDHNGPEADEHSEISIVISANSEIILTRENLAYQDLDSEDNEIIYHIESVAQMGRLEHQVDGDVTVGSTFTQADINDGLLKFYSSSGGGLATITDIIRFSVSDKLGNRIERQHLGITITPRRLHPPTAETGKDIKILPSSKKAITLENIVVTDQDTDNEHIEVIIDTSPSRGNIIFRDEDVNEISLRFNLNDIEMRKIFYTSFATENYLENITDLFVYHVNDGNSNSAQQKVDIIILQADKPDPVLRFQSVSCPAGKVILIDNQTVEIDDKTTDPIELLITVDTLPQQGNLYRLPPDFSEDAKVELKVGSVFTYQDILDGFICYKNLEANKLVSIRKRRDTLGLTVSNGVKEIHGELEIDTKPGKESYSLDVAEEEVPDFFDYGEYDVASNNVLEIERGSTSTITSLHLRVIGDDPIIYILTRDPTIGSLQLVDLPNNEIINLTSSSHDRNEFTQSHIDNGFLKYTSVRRFDNTEYQDVYFNFDVMGGPHNQIFHIVLSGDESKPKVITNTGLIVSEGDKATISDQQLEVTDSSHKLTFNVFKAPRWGKISNSAGSTVERFDEEQLENGEISYLHTSKSKFTDDEVVFEITNGKTSIKESFHITIIAVDSSLPIVENFGLKVQEGVRKTITEFHLKATDADTKDEQVTFVVTSAPNHGTIERSSSVRHYLPITSFTMNDIYNNRISYQHDGGSSLNDRLLFTVNDGTNKQFIINNDGLQQTTSHPQEFSIEVLPVEDGTPRLITNLGLNPLEYENGVPTGYITRKSLYTEDPDTDASELVYTIISSPKFGHLERDRGGRHYDVVKAFTQADINDGKVRYVMDVDESKLSEMKDSFVFNVHDSNPSYVTENSFIIRWSLISFTKAIYKVKEESETIEIGVERVGNLNQYAIVLCSTSNGTAKPEGHDQADYKADARQVQFDEHETEKYFSIQLKNDKVYEGKETFYTELSLPTYSLLGGIRRAIIEIDDEKDKPIIEFMESTYLVKETENLLSIPVKRSGDLTKKVSIVCYTESRSAKGSSQAQTQSDADYVTRYSDRPESIVTFQPGKTVAACNVKIIDDNIFENSEEFFVKIFRPSRGTLIGKLNEIKVTIAGPNDSPLVSISNSIFTFNEDAGNVNIPIHRKGSDLSFNTDVWCSTKQTTPISAIANQDFVQTSTKITFRPNETIKNCILTIMDDSQTPQVEGDETFIVHINSIVNGEIIQPSEALVIINDTLNDVPTMSFSKSEVEVKESVGVVALEIKRSGDLNEQSSVLCYTEEKFANVESDFVERPQTEFSRVVFKVGQSIAYCNVTIINDLIYESDENFVVKLKDARDKSRSFARVGINSQVTVTITNSEDGLFHYSQTSSSLHFPSLAPTLQFSKSEYFVREPTSSEESKKVIVHVVRSGDVSKVSKVRCSTRDGSAKSGSDYEPKSKVIRFQPGVEEVTFQINIILNEETDWHNNFLVILGPQEPVNAVMGHNSQTTVTILDKNVAGSLILPLPPLLVSLLDYDDVAAGLKTDPSPGYPLICVTPCDPKHPDFDDTQSLCEEAAINVTSIRFAWEVAMPTDEIDGIPPFERITDATPFTSVDRKVLDAIYFSRRFNIRCVAMVVDWVTNTPGTPLKSNVVRIGTENGLCHNSIESGSNRGFQAQSCITNLEYIGPADKDHGNSLHVSVKVPHQDGRLPLISTMPINNLKRLLSRSIDRHQHVCSNLMYSEDGNNKTSLLKNLGSYLGFISPTDYSKLMFGPGFDKPYQFDPAVREQKTIDLYKYLNLKSCVWQFDAYYHMNELIDHCNGKVTTDYQMRDTAESQVTVTIPLYVSYLYVTAPRGWGSLDHKTVMEVNFRYENVLWRTGIQTDGVLSGRIQVLRIMIRDDGKLVIEFKTQAKFRGLFVVKHRTYSEQESKVVPPEGMNIGFTLKNVWSETTYDSPYQIWEAVSTYSRKDYSGEYHVELLPCTVSPTQKWQQNVPGRPIQCTAYAPETFKIPITFQQTNRPIPVVYTLETKFQLCNNDKVFMLNPNDKDSDVSYDYKGAFTKGQTIYGRVLWSPEQDLKGAYRLQLEKVYLCTGRDGYVPYFDPTGSTYGGEPEYGCIEPSKKLKHRFLLLDRSNRQGQESYFHDVPFDAYFASDKPQFAAMSQMNGVDGFLMKVDALYKVEAGHQWYMQVLYIIGAESMTPRFRRSAIFQLDSRSKRSSKERLGNSKNGTNMRWLQIEHTENNTNSPALAIVLTIVGVLIVAGVVGCKVWCFKARKDETICKSNVEMDAIRKTKVDYKKSKVDENLLSTHREKDYSKSYYAEEPLLASRKNHVNADMEVAGKKHGKRRTCNIEIVDNLHGEESGTEV